MTAYHKMADSGSRSRFSMRLIASYALDWIILVVIVVAGGFLGRIEPNKRPFSLDDPNISFPFTDKETVPTWLLVVLCALVPIIVIFIVCILLVPGATVPKKTPYLLVWKRKLWELHVGWLGLLMAVGAAFFFISGIKNMCGKPRPDLLSRCEPDTANASAYLVGGGRGENGTGARLYSGSICKQQNRYKLNDGFRSYPSGHSATSAAGLIYLSLFLASKFAVTIPFVVPSAASQTDASMHVAFPSRVLSGSDFDAKSGGGGLVSRNARHNARIQSLRLQAAAPPVYLLAITLVPFCLAIFISASRWFDFRHHGFDILFGFIIGIVTAIYSFRYYHMPIMAGAGWAWGPRSEDRAFWAGVGRLGYVGPQDTLDARPDRPDVGELGDMHFHPGHTTGLDHRGAPSYPEHFQQSGPFQDVEMQAIEYSHRHK